MKKSGKPGDLRDTSDLGPVFLASALASESFHVSSDCVLTSTNYDSAQRVIDALTSGSVVELLHTQNFT